MTRRAGAAAVAAVVGCAVLAWLPSLGAGFLADDFILLQTAGGVHSPLSPFGRNDLGQGGGAGHFYRPLWVLWHAGLTGVFGERATALHAANLALFACVAVEVQLLARRLAGALPGLVAGIAFALYPRHGESVAWISGSTDLLAAALGLAAVLCLLAGWPERRRLAAAATLAVAGALAKEAAFLLPALAWLAIQALPPGERGLRLRGPGAMALALAAVLAVRTVAIGGLGGYGDGPTDPGRVAATALSYAVAAASPPQLELLRHPLLLVVPAAVAMLALLGMRALRARGHVRRLRLGLLGLAWFAVALVPVLGLPLDLNNSNGERLLLLPSVGLALTLAALVPEHLPRPRVALAAGAALLAALLCLDVARTWDRAGTLAERTASEAAALAPAGGRLVMLSFPDSYRSARVFTNGIGLAVSRAAGRRVTVVGCAPLLVRSDRPDTVRFAPLGGGRYIGHTGASAPFDFPVLRATAQQAPGCEYRRLHVDRGTPGLRLGAEVRPAPEPASTAFAEFDGSRVRPLDLASQVP